MTNDDDDDRAALAQGLDELSERGTEGLLPPNTRKARAARGSTSRNLQVRLSERDYAYLRVAATAAHVTALRPVSDAVCIRRAIHHYAAFIVSTLRDPEASAAERKALAMIRRGEGT